jgi:hypothetical protein
MSIYGKLAKTVGGGPVATYEVFFDNENEANACAGRYNARVEKLDDGWLVKKRVVSVSENDPIIQAIRKAVADLKGKS